MSTNLNEGSARIYQFPIGGRAGLQAHRGSAQSDLIAAARQVKATSSGWYHEAAVLEDRTIAPQ